VVDAASGTLSEITHDRAMDADPSWVDDGTIVFRSDREAETFRLFLIDRRGERLRRVAGSPDNAFTPEVDAAARTIYFARYSARGYDLAAAAFGEGGTAQPYVDPLPEARRDPPSFDGPARNYKEGRTLAPRFVTPFVELVSDEWRVGLATAAFDPLVRTAWGAAGSWGTEVAKANGLAYVRYDRFTPTFTALARFESSPVTEGVEDLREARVSIDFPIERSALRNQTLDLTVRRRRQEVAPDVLHTGVLAGSWVLDSTRSYPMSISPQDGFRLRVSATRELKALGSDLDFGQVIVDARAYASMRPMVVVARAGYGTTFGPRIPRSAYAIGGLSSSALLDPVGDEPAVLRGFESAAGSDVSRFGRRIGFANLEFRVPLAHPQRGIGALPVFLRHLHLSAGLDAAVVSQSRLDLGSTRAGASIGMGADVFLGHRIPITIAGGLGFGLNHEGRAVPWFSLGLPF